MVNIEAALVGSKSKDKKVSVAELVPLYPILNGAKVFSVKVELTGFTNQPMSLKETIRGAELRAQGAYEDTRHYKSSRLGFGIESGLTSMPHDESRFIDVCVCSIYNGHTFSIGWSMGFEIPAEVLVLIKTEGLELRDAFVKAQMLKNKNQNPKLGVVEFLTNKKVSRVAFTKSAIMMALIPFEHPDLYGEMYE